MGFWTSGSSFGGSAASGKHGKAGGFDRGRGGNIDKHGKTGKHHGGWLWGGGSGGSAKPVKKDFWGNPVKDKGGKGGKGGNSKSSGWLW